MPVISRGQFWSGSFGPQPKIRDEEVQEEEKFLAVKNQWNIWNKNQTRWLFGNWGLGKVDLVRVVDRTWYN